MNRFGIYPMRLSGDALRIFFDNITYKASPGPLACGGVPTPTPTPTPTSTRTPTPLPTTSSTPPPGPGPTADDVIVINNFDLNPKLICSVAGSSTQFQMTLAVTIDVAKFRTECGNVNSFNWGIKVDNAWTIDALVYGEVNSTFNPTSSVITVDLSRSVNLNTSGQQVADIGLNNNEYYAEMFCSDTTSIDPFGSLARSSSVIVNYGSGVNKNWACIAANNVFACSPAKLTDCSDASACAGRPCIEIGGNLCGESAIGASCGGVGGGGGGTPGTDQSLTWKLINPLAGSPQPTDIFGVIYLITNWVLNIVDSLLIILIIYSGVMFMISRGNPGEIQKAKSILYWALVGFAVTLVGKGFIFIIDSVLRGGIPLT
jgi:hypothetical protein